MFYLGAKIRISGLLDRGTTLPVDRLEKLSPSLFMDSAFPHWLIAFSTTTDAEELLTYFQREREVNGRVERYSYELVTNLNVCWFDTSRPELPWHTFGPEKNFDPNRESVYVLKRVDAPKTSEQTAR